MSHNPILVNKISKILNWGQMKADVALPAIERIINNYAYLNTALYGVDPLSDPELKRAFEKDLVTMPADSLFSYLLTGDIDEITIKWRDVEMFVSLRREIENEMIVHHLPYREAINEWFK